MTKRGITERRSASDCREYERPPSQWPYFDSGDIAEVRKVLQSGNVNYSTGQHGKLFEREFADYLGCRHGIALANGTVALELALHALDIGEGDEVIVTPRSYFGSVSSILLRRARPVFADVDRNSQNITAATVAPLIGPRTRAIVCVHLAGWPCEMKELLELARVNRLAVIEDCAQAHGASIDGQMVGTFGSVGCFSFCQDKILSTGGEGGFVCMDDEGLWRKSWAYKDNGKPYKAVHETEYPPGYRWVHQSLGTNWRLTEMQSVIGRRQIKKLETWLATRREYADHYHDRLDPSSAARLTRPPSGVRHAYYKYYFFVRSEALRSTWDRDRVIKEVNDKGVPCFSGSCPEIYLEQAVIDAGATPSERLPVARELGATSVMVCLHPTMSHSEVAYVGDTLREVLARATKR